MIDIPAITDLLGKLITKYQELDKWDGLCRTFHERMERLTKVLGSINPQAVDKGALLEVLKEMIGKFDAMVTAYAGKNFVERAWKNDEFQAQVRLYNEELDSLIRQIPDNVSDQLAELLDWQKRFNEQSQEVFEQLNEMKDMNRKIWESVQSILERMETTNELLMSMKSSSSANHRLSPLYDNIIKIAETNFLNNKTVETPPSWFIAADEVKQEEPIAIKTQASIYRGTWQGAHVAIKKFHILRDEHPVFQKHFVVWHSLQHPNVAHLFGAGSDRGAPFFVYEFASRQSLDRCWDRLSTKQIWGVLHQAVIGLIYLHRKHIVHGNLSCSKILVTEGGNAKLFGFGASYLREHDKSNIDKPTTRYEFAAPECVGLTDGLSHSPRFESDVYSFGITIMEAIGKANPFIGVTDILATKSQNDLPQPAHMSVQARTLVQQMCEVDVTKRVSLMYVATVLEGLAK